ncbi:Probable long-chain-alcohol O-fatty-acyltransferase [Seminavis robusta]|uniref:Probable long-chain-alcohol O-fatty-acyltransferase n=1 Tax=Seminavis robusta TaxID=568900 RepID=A0A9N8E6B2_9STRA|nr:Probable long-chain-alcohol O-fatty-acyltransferase [Seminavis robusta]|eukprot:Sro718_g192240.1 Probable long-chain-alcohol O-fatty-acyltransferase (454) ;mRNA; f:46072-47652
MGVHFAFDASWDSLPHTWRAPMEPERMPFFTLPPTTLSIWEGTTISIPEVEFYFFSVAFWLELLVIFVVLIALAIVVGCVLYQYCIKPKRAFTSSSYIVAYGVVLPFWLVLPYMASSYFRVENKIIRFMLTTVVTSISIFRTTAAVHGFSPQHATKSISDFAFYYACPVRATYDTKRQQYQRATRASIRKRVIRFHTSMVIAGVVASIYQMFPNIFPPLSEPSSPDDPVWYDWRQIINPSNLWANVCYAAFFQCYLTLFAESMMFIQVFVTRIDCEETMDNPVFGSTSPSEFWGRRWNRLIHDCLKRGVFLPVKRQFASTTLAVMAAFCASGVFHEWLQITVFPPSWDHYVDDSDGSCHLWGRTGSFSSRHCYTPKYGVSLAFFMWQAVLIAIEFAAMPHCKDLFLNVPAQIKTVMTVIAGGCVAHWFTEPYVHSTFFLDGTVALCTWKLKGN